MVFIPRISLKTGINPSLLRSFPTDGNYSGTQKLLLAKTRIFGSKIGYLINNIKRKLPIGNAAILDHEIPKEHIRQQQNRLPKHPQIFPRL
jgi:hypothetical protein